MNFPWKIFRQNMMKSCPWMSHHLLRRIFWMSHLIPMEICWIPTEITWRIMIPSPHPGTIRHLPPKAVPVLTAQDQAIPNQTAQTHLMTVQKVKCHCSLVMFHEVFVWTEWAVTQNKYTPHTRFNITNDKICSTIICIGCRFLSFRHSKQLFVINWLIYNSYLLQLRYFLCLIITKTSHLSHIACFFRQNQIKFIVE